jgi:hypothetical protein
MKMILFSLIAGAFIGATASAQDRVGNAGNLCIVERGQQKAVIEADEFFSGVAAESRGGRCTYGKLKSQDRSGRVYYDGRKVADGLSNSQAQDVKAEVRARYDLSGCANYVCDEFGPNGSTSDDPQPPTSGGGSYENF